MAVQKVLTTLDMHVTNIRLRGLMKQKEKVHVYSVMGYERSKLFSYRELSKHLVITRIPLYSDLNLIENIKEHLKARLQFIYGKSLFGGTAQP